MGLSKKCPIVSKCLTKKTYFSVVESRHILKTLKILRPASSVKPI